MSAALKVNNLSEFNSALDSALAAMEREVTHSLRGFAVTVFRELVENSPQWSGNLAANWNIGINVPSHEYTELVDKAGSWYGHADQQHHGDFVAHVRGAHYAVGVSIGKNLPRTRAIGLRDTVFINNNTPYLHHVEADESDEGESPYIRPENKIDGVVALREYVRAKYATLTIDARTYIGRHV
ncbi:hypothetical protein [Cupriavidus necator]